VANLVHKKRRASNIWWAFRRPFGSG